MTYNYCMLIILFTSREINNHTSTRVSTQEQNNNDNYKSANSEDITIISKVTVVVVLNLIPVHADPAKR